MILLEEHCQGARPRIISRAHEVVEATGKSSPQLYVCRRCHKSGELKDLFEGARCFPHVEFADSGWTDEG